ILGTTSASWTMRAEIKGLDKPLEIKCYVSASGFFRQEWAAGYVSVVDIAKGESLTLIPAAKKAILTKMLNMPEDIRKRSDMLGELKKMIQGAEEELGEKDIDGAKAVGYRVRTSGHEMELWVDPQTMRPVLMKINVGGDMGTATMTDFQMNPELDESLFNMEVPEGEGYTIEEKTMDFGVKAEDILEGLRLLAKYNGGKFPAGRMPLLSRKIIENMKEAKVSKAEMKAFVDTYQRTGMFFVLKMGRDVDFRYFGEGVKLGDAARPIMWWRQEDSQTYRVLYGDLTLKDVAASDLPTTRPAEE
ncbi:hypothetical protein LCGC14_3074100, partial [marine sediment metagenome]